MKILQIIPAQPGWNVAYKKGTCKWSPGHEEAGGVELIPVACWALVQDAQSGGARVVPMTGGDSGAALVPQDVDNNKALGISPPGRRPRDWLPKLRRSEGGTRKIEKTEKSKPRTAAQAATAAEPPKQAAPDKVAAVQEAISASQPEAESLSDAETTIRPAISLTDVMDSSYSVSEAAPATSDEGGIPSGDVLDLDF